MCPKYEPLAINVSSDWGKALIVKLEALFKLEFNFFKEENASMPVSSEIL